MNADIPSGTVTTTPTTVTFSLINIGSVAPGTYPATIAFTDTGTGGNTTRTATLTVAGSVTHETLSVSEATKATGPVTTIRGADDTAGDRYADERLVAAIGVSTRADPAARLVPGRTGAGLLGRRLARCRRGVLTTSEGAVRRCDGAAVAPHDAEMTRGPA